MNLEELARQKRDQENETRRKRRKQLRDVGIPSALCDQAVNNHWSDKRIKEEYGIDLEGTG